MIGVYAPSLVALVAEALHALGAELIMVPLSDPRLSLPLSLPPLSRELQPTAGRPRARGRAPRRRRWCTAAASTNSRPSARRSRRRPQYECVHDQPSLTRGSMDQASVATVTPAGVEYSTLDCTRLGFAACSIAAQPSATLRCQRRPGHIPRRPCAVRTTSRAATAWRTPPHCARCSHAPRTRHTRTHLARSAPPHAPGLALSRDARRRAWRREGPPGPCPTPACGDASPSLAP